MDKLKHINILLVEDDDIDAEAVKRALRQLKCSHTLHRAANGIEALELLRGEGCPALERPNVVLLDLNMPLMNGIEFLDELRADPQQHDTIVFVLTTSNDDRDKAAAYAKQVAGFLVKQHVGEEFHLLIDALRCYWQYIEFPPAT